MVFGTSFFGFLASLPPRFFSLPMARSFAVEDEQAATLVPGRARSTSAYPHDSEDGGDTPNRREATSAIVLPLPRPLREGYSLPMSRLGRLALLSTLALLAACSKAKQASDLPADLGQSLNPAFLTAFGGDAPADHPITRAGKAIDLSFSPAVIARLSDNEAALASIAAPADGGCNACTWSVAVHYLKAKDNRFTVEKAFFDVATQGPLDDPPHLRVRYDLFDGPTLEAESPRRDRGCDMTVASLFELTPEGPKLRASEVPTARNNIPMGALRAGPQVDLYGNVIADKKGKTFKVHYHGSTEGDVTWTAGPDGVFRASGGVPLPGC